MTAAEYRAWLEAFDVSHRMAVVLFGVNYRRSRRWAAGTEPIPLGIAEEIKSLPRERIEAVREHGETARVG